MIKSPSPLPGDELRDQAAAILSTNYGRARKEERISGKKVDVYFEYTEFGKTKYLYVEAKDYQNNLTRSDLVHIVADYQGVIKQKSPSNLLIVSRNGISTDASKYIDENDGFQHQTIDEVLKSSVDLSTYMDDIFDKTDKINNYYVENTYKSLSHPKNTNWNVFDQKNTALKDVLSWIENERNDPVAILGGYGSGKTSLAQKIARTLSDNAQSNTNARQPIVIPLGGVSKYSNIEGLLSSLLTNDHDVRNFNCRNFLRLNDKGKYVIILDGFDEMKHAMTWHDFKGQIKELLRLQNEKSKILLLGRPSAFLSEDEERHILRGERRISGEDWVRLPDWPQFFQIRLNHFSADERRKFVHKYLCSHNKDDLSDSDIRIRADKTNAIADNDNTLFSKPVHAKILTDLATDSSFDLDKFEADISRWTLYKNFFTSIYEREYEKETRRSISAEDRIKFLKELAFWLWMEKGSAISFALNELPKGFVHSIFNVDKDESEDIIREAMIGSILEKKDRDVYFFGHRSFAESLVSSRMIDNPPRSVDHEGYSKAYRDGVKVFIEEARKFEDISVWADTFGNAKGKISLTYIEMLADVAGSFQNLVSNIDENSVWSSILRNFHNDFSKTQINFSNVIHGISRLSDAEVSWLILWLFGDGKQHWSDLRRSGTPIDIDLEFTCAFFENLFSKCNQNGRALSIDGQHSGLVNIFKRGFKLYEGRIDEIELDYNLLREACIYNLKGADIPWEKEIELHSDRGTLSAGKILSRLQGGSKVRFEVFLKHVRSVNSITVVERKTLKNRSLARKRTRR